MEEGLITISWLNDFIFCPISIYFHNLYGPQERRIFQRTDQVLGTASHASIDEHNYSTRKDVLTALDVHSEEFGLIGKIDLLDVSKGALIERKRKIVTIYDGYIFQLFGQYYCLTEMGFPIHSLALHSMVDNKTYPIAIPPENRELDKKFRNLLSQIKSFQPDGFIQTNVDKCRGCIYEPACDRSLL